MKEVLSASEQWSKYLDNSFNMAIVPLIVCFLGVVAFKVATII
jgi:hypothetical protein